MLCIPICFVGIIESRSATPKNIKDGTITATASLPEVMAFLKAYPDATTRVIAIDDRTVQVSYYKAYYDYGNSNNARGRTISLAIVMNSTTFNASDLVVSCYPMGGGVSADSARAEDIVPFISASKARCFGIE